MLESVEARVQHGVDLLNEFKPLWRNSIRLSEFDIGSKEHCVLGQVFGNYNIGVSRMGLDENTSMRFGFTNQPITGGDSESEKLWRDLGRAWYIELSPMEGSDVCTND